MATITKSLKHIKKELEFSEAPGLVYGYYGDYMVSFSLLDREIELFVDAALDENDSDALGKLRTFLKGNAAAYELTGTSFSPTGISVRTLEKNYEALLEFFFIFMNQLKLLHVAGREVCANCGEKIRGDGVVLKIGNHAHTCDETCAQKIMEGGKAKTQARSKGRALPGVIGAGVVGLLGAVPYFVLGTLGLPCAPAAFLMPLAAAFGFYAFGGRPGTGKVITCILVPIVVYLLACFALLGFVVYSDWSNSGFVFSFKELFDTIRRTFADSAEFREQFFNRQMLFGGLFLLVGYVFTIPTAFTKREPYFMLLKDTDNG